MKEVRKESNQSLCRTWLVVSLLLLLPRTLLPLLLLPLLLLLRIRWFMRN